MCLPRPCLTVAEKLLHAADCNILANCEFSLRLQERQKYKSFLQNDIFTSVTYKWRRECPFLVDIFVTAVKYLGVGDVYRC